MNKITMALVCICVVAAVILVAFLLRCKTVRMAASIEDTLDQMLSGSFHDRIDFYNDTLSGKINIKLKRMYEIMEGQSTKSAAQHGQIQELVSDISHQVKTPVANIKMLNETLAQSTLPPNKRAELQTQMDTQVGKLDALIQALVKASRLEAGIVELSPMSLPVRETLAQAIGGAALLAERKGIAITVACDSGVSTLHDRKWTAEALFNILDNAVKYTPDGGAVDITCVQWEIYTKIDVSDTGIGISEDELAQVFRRFYRSPAVQQQDGVGIGLFLSREIVQKQGGYIKAVSMPGEGTTFSVFLPNS